MTTIKINIKDEYMDEFLEKIQEFAKENNLTGKELNIFGLSIEKYIEIYRKNKS